MPDYLVYMIKNDHIIMESKMYVRKVSVILGSAREWQFFVLHIANCVIREVSYPATYSWQQCTTKQGISESFHQQGNSNQVNPNILIMNEIYHRFTICKIISMPEKLLNKISTKVRQICIFKHELSYSIVFKIIPL